MAKVQRAPRRQVKTRRPKFPRGQANPGSRLNRPKTGAGRRKGVLNKFTRDLKEAVLNALEKLGGEDYLVMLGKRERRAFANLLGKAMPLQVTGANGSPLLPRTVSVAVNFVKPDTGKK